MSHITTLIANLAEERAAKRRQRQDDSKDHPNASSLLLQLGFTSEKYRVGCPPLHRLPVVQDALIDEHSPEYIEYSKLRPRIDDALSNPDFSICSPKSELTREGIVIDPQRDLTINVNAIWTNASESGWLMAVEAIKTILMGSDLLKDAFVVIQDHKWCGRPRTYDIVEPEHPIVGQWETILRPAIRAILRFNPKLWAGWHAIDVLRKITVDTWDDDWWLDDMPNIVIVQIRIGWEVDKDDWLPAKLEIDSLLQKWNCKGVEVEFEYGDLVEDALFPVEGVKHQHDDLLDESYDRGYPDQIPKGAPIGPAQQFKKHPEQGSAGGQPVPIHGPIGTFGGYIRGTRKDGSETKDFGLTCYNVVRVGFPGHQFKSTEGESYVSGFSGPDTPLHNLDIAGFKPHDPIRQDVLLESPLRRQNDYTLQYLEETYLPKIKSWLVDLVEPEDGSRLKEVQDEIRHHEVGFITKRQFFNRGHHIAGVPWAGSGFCNRTDDGGRLDWCLIELKPNRIGENRVPRHDGSWKNGRQYPFCKSLSSVASPGNLLSGSKLFKLGAMSNGRHGRLSHIKSDLRIKHVDERLGIEESREHLFVTPGTTAWENFSEPGDLGSMVFTMFGEWVGLLHYSPKKSAHGYAYMTEAVAILRHMEEWMGGEWTFGLP